MRVVQHCTLDIASMNDFSSPASSFEVQPMSRTTACFGWTWLIIAAVVALDIIGMRWMPHAARVNAGPGTVYGFGTLIVIIGWFTLRTRTSGDASRWGQRLASLSFTTLWMLTFVAFGAAAAVLGYLSVEANFPLIDGTLARFDEAVGFDWMVWYGWVIRHRIIFVALSAAYWSGTVQAIFVPLLLGATGRRSEMIRHIIRTMLATLVAIAISTPLPAASAFLHFHIVGPGTASTVSSFFPLRNGTLNVFDLAALQGLVSMPSMHVTMAVLFVEALKRMPRLAAPALVLNAMMIASAPSQGGHYLADVVTGLLLAWATIRLVEKIRIEA
jgi:hypothetical protein